MLTPVAIAQPSRLASTSVTMPQIAVRIPESSIAPDTTRQTALLKNTG